MQACCAGRLAAKFVAVFKDRTGAHEHAVDRLSVSVDGSITSRFVVLAAPHSLIVCPPTETDRSLAAGAFKGEILSALFKRFEAPATTAELTSQCGSPELSA